MKKVYIWGLIGLLALVGLGCSQQQDHKGRIPLVEVAGKFLYQDDLQAALPLNLSADDSVLFAESYIKNWVEDVLLFEKAEGNIPDNDRVMNLVESYRKALVMHAYQEALVKQRLADEITSDEVLAYYNQNKQLFVLDKPLVKGLFMKVPLKSPNLSDVRRWYKRNTQEAIEQLEKYSFRNAVTYDYFYDHWRPLEEIEALIPGRTWNPDSDYLKQNRNVELKDTAFYYFLHVEEFQGKGEQKPLDFAEEEIKEILINLKRVEFINSVKDELYHQASDRNRINYYYLDSDSDE
ncbi:MAG: peptidyl-prolyl cis-trans isomerase [Bacteroides sp.]|nr:peptidyl-prolyl cis-trans isomerase [Bacteroides sp.]